ncbi:hypothetical protein ACHAWT_004682 [Skeletonema menzelii]|eukprot:scaffold4423_cov159-Skeletonema_menzelii.AAC.5
MNSILSTAVAYASPAVSLFSANSAYQSSTSKIVHLIRHAEGTHNLNEEESKLPLHFDAKLTEKGVNQCNELAKRTKDLNVEAIVVSPLSRTLDTAILSFPHLYGDSKNKKTVPFIAHEEWRETVNFLCDARRPTSVLQQQYPHICFNNLMNDEDDPIWAHYESIFGDYSAHLSKRESDDPISLYNRANSAWKVLLNRPEKNIALVGHSAFFMHMFTPLFEELNGVVKYEDASVAELMNSRFDNCELRSVKVDLHTG